jgi:hypothetical protein
VRALIVAAVAALAVVGPFACGGGGGDTDETGAREQEQEQEGESGGEREECERLPGESQREECERAGAAAVIPERDRVAYYQLATGAGLLRSAAVAASRGEGAPATAGPAELAAARDRVDRTRPRDHGLTAVRRQLVALLGLAERGLGRAAALRDLAAIRSIEGTLNAYLRREPANAVLLPD